MKNLEDLTGYDKVAIIFDILGDSLSINMFKDIPEAEFYKIRDHAKHLRNDVPTSVKKEVLEDYLVLLDQKSVLVHNQILYLHFFSYHT